MSLEEGIKRVQKGFFAFHVELSRGYKVVSDLFQEHEKCALKEVAFVNLIEPWMPVRKNSPYKKIFKIGYVSIKVVKAYLCLHVIIWSYKLGNIMN